jgi:hypothetical protein
MSISRRERARRWLHDGVLLACVAAFASACAGSAPADAGAPAKGNDGEQPGAPARWDFAYFYADGTHLYGVSSDAHTVTPVVSGSPMDPVGPITFDRSYVYYAGADPGSADTLAVMAQPVDGSRSPVPLVTNVSSVTALALDDTSLYILGSTYTTGQTGVTNFTTSLTQVPLDAEGVDASTLVKLAEEPAARGLELSVSDGNVYFSEAVGESPTSDPPAGARVRRVSATGGAPETVAEATNLTYFAVDAGELYYLDTGGLTIDCGPLNPTIEHLPSDGSAMTQVATGLPVQGPLAVREGALYFSTRGKGCTGEPASDLLKLTSPGGSVETLVSGVTGPADFYFSDQDLYFTYYRSGAPVPAVTPL